MLWTSLIRGYLRNKRFRKKNIHNSAGLSRHSIINEDNVEVGKETYGNIIVKSYDDSLKLKVGNYCSIAPHVEFLLGIEHPVNLISTYPFKALILDRGITSDAVSKGNIIVDDDVWIGQNSLIMSGVHIGQGAVVAAGAVVTKDVPPYAIVGGVPARILKYRFTDELIEELLKIDYSMLSKKLIFEHEEDLYREFLSKEQIAWMPRR